MGAGLWRLGLAALISIVVFAAPAYAYRLTPVTAVFSATHLTEAAGNASAASDALVGFGGGLSWEIPLSRFFGLELGGFYLQRKFGTILTTNTLTTLHFPIQVRVPIWKVLLGVGGFFNRGLGSVQVRDSNTADSSTLSSTLTYDEARLKPSAAGVLFSAGLILPIAKGAGILGEGRYLRSLTDSSTVPGAARQFTDLQLLIGLTFSPSLAVGPDLDAGAL